MKFKVVITDYEFADLCYEEMVLSQLDQLTFVKAQCQSEDDIIKAAADADALLNQYAPITGKVIQALTRCKIISRYGVGVNTIDVNKATEKGIYVANVPDYCMEEVSDHTIALLLSWARKVTFFDRQIKRGVWDFKQGSPIYRIKDKTLGLIGFGHIPRKVASKAQGFGLNVLVYDPFVDEKDLHPYGAKSVTLDTLLQHADFVSIHVPLNQDTEEMINICKLRLMKKTAVLINTSRGPVIAEADLIQALREGMLAGAALDVLKEEPIQANHPFLQMDNVILTPHVAWNSVESEAELRRKCTQNVVDTLLGGQPAYLVNPQAIRNSP